MSINTIYNYTAILSYIGINYSGWQIQREEKNTIQEIIIKTIEKVLETKILKSSYTGRTDRGVSALTQYFNFFIEEKINDCKCFIPILNKNLPNDIFIIDFFKVDNTFSARFDAIQKSYVYKISFVEDEEIIKKYNLVNVLILKKANKSFLLERLNKFIPLFNGKRDYSSYYRPEKDVHKNTVINLSTSFDIYDFPEFFVLTLTFTAPYFLRNMIRKIVGMFLAFLQDKVDLKYIEGTFDQPCPSKGKFLAPPEPLVLYSVEYRKK